MIDYGFIWDSSISLAPQSTPVWPYTLDFAIPHKCKEKSCPTRQFPGMWEVPLNSHFVEVKIMSDAHHVWPTKDFDIPVALFCCWKLCVMAISSRSIYANSHIDLCHEISLIKDIRAAAGKAPNAWALPKFWGSLHSYKKPVIRKNGVEYWALPEHIYHYITAMGFLAMFTTPAQTSF